MAERKKSTEPPEEDKKEVVVSDRPDKFSKRTLVKPLTLPSKGILYEGNLPDGRVRIAAFTTREEKLFSASGGVGEDKIEQALSACLDAEGINPMDLLIADRFFCLVHIRSLSYGDAYHFTTRCSECGRQSPHHISLIDDLNCRDINEDLIEPFDIHLKVCKKDVALRFLRGRDEREIRKLSETSLKKRRRVEKGVVDDPSYIFRIAKHIVTVDGEQLSWPVLVDFVSNLEGPDSLAIDHMLEEYGFGFDGDLDIECPHCGFLDERVSLPVRPEFFRPRRT